MKKTLTLFLFLLSVACFAQDTTYYKNVNLIVIDPGGVPVPDPGCKTCIGNIVVDAGTGVMTISYTNGTSYISPPLKGPKGDAGRGITSTVVDPLTGVLTITYTDGTKYISPPLMGSPGQCSGCPPSGGGAGYADIKVYNVQQYGAKGDGVNDDTEEFQSAINACIANKGKLVVPSPTQFYKITNTLLFTPGASGQVHMMVDAWGWGNGTNTLRWFGPSDKPVTQWIGIKQILVTGLSIGIEPGKTGVILYDIDTRSAPASSSTGSTFKSMYLDLGTGVNNVAFRLGNQSGGNGDISNIQWENIAIYGSRKEGQIGYLIEGQNTLSQTWMGGFCAFLHHAISNGGTGGTSKRGNGSLFVFGLGCSQNIVDFRFNFEQNYVVQGGRFEGSGAVVAGRPDLSGSKFAIIGPHSYHSSVSFRDCHISEYEPPDGDLVSMQTGGSLVMDNCEGFRLNREIPFIIGLNGNGNKGVVMINGGAYSTQPNNLIHKVVGATQFKAYVRGVSRYTNLVYTNEWFADQNGTLY